MIPHALGPQSIQAMSIAGAGFKASHIIITNSKAFTGSKTRFVYLIECYTDGAKFDGLKEIGDGKLSKNVASARLDPGGNGYPQGSFIPGKFTYIKPDASTVVAGFVIELK